MQSIERRESKNRKCELSAEGSQYIGVFSKYICLLEFDKLKVIYDYGFEKVFYVQLVKELKYKPETANQYPKIVDGKGKGIIDDITVEEYSEIVKKVKTGKMTYRYDGMSVEEMPWHPDDYSVEKDNSTIRSYVRRIKYACEYGCDE